MQIHKSFSVFPLGLFLHNSNVLCHSRPFQIYKVKNDFGGRDGAQTQTS